MRNAPNPSIYRPVKPPCKKRGVDCPRRSLVCRSDCQEWEEYQKRIKEEKKKAWKANAGDFFTGEYQTKAGREAAKKARR